MKITGLSQMAYGHLSVDDIEILESFIGSETEYSIINDEMLIMPDGEYCHEDFLILEP